MSEGKNKGGQPTKYNDQLAREICDAITRHPASIEKICRLYSHFPGSDTIRTWIQVLPAFREMYAKAKQSQLDLLAEDLLNVEERINKFADERGNIKYDNASVAALKLEHDNRKWLLSKLKPKKYGDVQSNSDDNSAAILELTKLINKLAPNFESDY